MTATITRPKEFNVLDLGRELTRMHESKRDFVAGVGNMTISSQQGKPAIVLGSDHYQMNGVAHNQIAEFANIPAAFYNRVLTNGYKVPMMVEEEEQEFPLYDVLMNSLLKPHSDKNRLVRTLDGKARAFLSDRFSLDIDNFDVFNTAAKIIQRMGLNAEDVISSSITENSMYLKVLSPRLKGDVNVGDTVQGGFILSNSEVGMGSLCIRQFIYRLVCKNGAVTEEAYRQRHVGGRLAENNDGMTYSAETREADSRVRLLMMRDHIEGAIDEHKFKTTLSLMQDATTIQMPAKRLPSEVIEVTRKMYPSIGKDEAKDIEAYMIHDGDMSLWGLSNAITRAAQDAVSYDKQVEMETIGGQIYHLSQSDKRSLMHGRN